MYFTATIRAYDALTEVVWVADVREWSGSDAEPRGTVALRMVGQTHGEGLEEPVRWLRTLLEDIREHM